MQTSKVYRSELISSGIITVYEDVLLDDTYEFIKNAGTMAMNPERRHLVVNGIIDAVRDQIRLEGDQQLEQLYTEYFDKLNDSHWRDVTNRKFKRFCMRLYTILIKREQGGAPRG